MEKFVIDRNRFLATEVNGYFHQLYTGFREDDNPDFLNILKNTFGCDLTKELLAAKNKTKEILKCDISKIMIAENMTNCICMCIPRSKALNTYVSSQLMFQEAVSNAANDISGVTDGTGYITRIKDTYTTHLDKATQDGRLTIPNDGEKPYPGITRHTCKIDGKSIKNQNIILVDDIYTKSINIDEDCIQALLENGARKVVFYSIGYTRRN